MTNDILIDLINNGELDKLKSTLEVSKYAYFITDSYNWTNTTPTQSPYVRIKDFKEYNPKQHDIHNERERPDKLISGEDGRLTGKVKVSRLSIPEQKRIVVMAASFLGSPELASNPAPGLESELLEVIQVIFDNNKLDYEFKNIAKKTMSERECAELWYTQEAEADYWEGTPMQGAKFKLRMRIISPSLGDTLYPVYDNFGDMIAFGRYYETVETVANSISQTNKTCHFDIYTKDRFYFMTKGSQETTWTFNYDPNDAVYAEDGTVVTPSTTKGIPNPIGKIPVIYYSQPATEWHDVQEMIDRLEKKISNHADTNDYYDSPIVKAKGNVQGFSEKGESGKVLQMDEGADASYLTYDSLPESMKMEMDNLTKFINTYTHTPDISFESVSGLGHFSGIALKMFFMDAHLKASDKEAIFGMGVTRRINYLKAAISVIDNKFKPALKLIVSPKFTYFLPKDTDAEVATLINAYQAGIISLESAVKLNPLVEDAVNELDLIKKEAAVKAKLIPPPTPPMPDTKSNPDKLPK